MAAVLYVGEDLCRRISFMQHGGFTVKHSECSSLAVAAVLSEKHRFHAIAFDHDTFPLPQGIFLAVRWHSASPLVLFENPNIARYYGIDHDDDAFDLVIPALTPPRVWFKALQALIADFRTLQVASHSSKRFSSLSVGSKTHG